MHLSNTAVPKYYGQFREDVKDGRIIVNKYISMEMNRIDNWIKNPGIYYDPDPVEGYIKFCEHELTLTDGSDLHLLDSFKLWAEQLYGWYYFVERKVWVPDPSGRGGRHIIKKIKKRLINIQYIILGRGGAKTLYGETIQAYHLVVDQQTTHQITVAPTMKQAEEILSPFRTAILRAKGPVFKFLTMGSLQNTTGSKAERVKLASTKKGIENFMTGSLLEIRPMSIDKLQGLRCKVATVDEWLSCEIRQSPIDAISQGAAKGLDNDYIIVATSSEGTARNGVGDTIKMELMDILKGDYDNPHVSIWYYRLDDIKEINDEAMWIKANPNLGKTVTYETYQLDVERAEKAPATKNDILAKRFGIPCEGYTYYFTYEETLHSDIPKNFDGMPCSLGIDLSQGDDFCAFTFLFPLRDGSFGVKTINYITTKTLHNLTMATRVKYEEEFIKEGSLVVLDGVILDLMAVYDHLDKYILDHQYEVRSLGYDPYNASSFIDRWEKENGPYGIVKVRQGSITESVPLGEIKKLAEERMLIFDQDIMTYTMGNCVTMEDSNGNRKLLKQRSDKKIDAVAAMMDAFIAYKDNKDYYD